MKVNSKRLANAAFQSAPNGLESRHLRHTKEGSPYIARAPWSSAVDVADTRISVAGASALLAQDFNATLAQLVEAMRSDRIQCQFKSDEWYHFQVRFGVAVAKW